MIQCLRFSAKALGFGRPIRFGLKKVTWEILFYYSAQGWNTIKSLNTTPAVVLLICYFEAIPPFFCVSSLTVSNIVSSIQTSIKLVL